MSRPMKMLPFSHTTVPHRRQIQKTPTDAEILEKSHPLIRHMSTSTASSNNSKKMSSERSVRFSEEAVRDAERAEAAREVAALAKQKPNNFCIKKGKWYDCLRPVPGYMGGGIVDFDAEYKKKNVGIAALKKSGKV